MRIVLALSRQSAAQGGRCVRDILQALAQYNEAIIRAGGVPPLYKSGVRYRRENGESFQDCTYILAQKWGDCSNLVAWRVGELLAQGEPAKVRMHWRVYQDGKRIYHITVRRGDGTIEDPSRILGM